MSKGLQASREDDGEMFYELDDFLKNRENTKTMRIFCQRFLPCAVGKYVFKKRKAIEKVSEFASVSDEAFVLLVLENIWEATMEKDMKEWKRDKLLRKNLEGTEKRERKQYACGKYTQNGEFA